MFFGKNKEKLSVELVDVEVDTSEMINIKDSRVVYINGAGKLREVRKEVKNLKNGYLSQIRLNNVPLIQMNKEYIPTIESLLATGYGIENANCKEILEIQGKINLDFISLENSIKTMTPLLKLLDNGFYMIADAECYPTDGNGNFFWNVPNNMVLNPATAEKCLIDNDFTYIAGQPAYLYPTQTTDVYNPERIEYYIEKLKKMNDNNEPRAIVYNFGQFINFIIDGHHKACAAALLRKPLKCILIKKAGYFSSYEKGKWISKLYFFSIFEKAILKNIPKKYLPLKKDEMEIKKLNEIKLENGKVNKRKWENKYLDSVKNFPSLEKYANIVNASINFEFKITDELIKKYVNIFDENSQEMMKKIIYILMYTESLEKLQKIVIKYAKNSLNHKIDKDLKLMIYDILFQMKNNTEVEQIFIDYIVYNEDRDDPILKLANSYWK